MRLHSAEEITVEMQLPVLLNFMLTLNDVRALYSRYNIVSSCCLRMVLR
jgi:Trp operon repressor